MFTQFSSVQFSCSVVSDSHLVNNNILYWPACVHIVYVCMLICNLSFSTSAMFLKFICVDKSSVLAWRIPGMEEPGGLPSMGSHRVGHNWSDLAAAAH